MKPETKTILLVEDERLVALHEQQVLERNGYVVRLAARGEEAINLARDPAVSMVLMDIDLGTGGMPGTDAAKRILRERTLPIVFLTSHSERAIVDQVKDITRYGYVLKSAGEFVLIETISMAFELFNAQEELRSRNDLVETIIRTSPEGFLLLDTAGTILEVNDAYCRFTGYDRDDLLAASLSMIELNENTQEIELHIDRVISEGHDQFITTHRRKDGTPIQFEVVTSFFPEFGGRFVSFVRDIGDRLAYEKHLERRDRMLEDIAKNSPGMVYQFRIDTDGEWGFPFIGSAVERYFGYSTRAVQNDTTILIEAVHPEDRERLRDTVMESQRSLSDYALVHRIVAANGSTHWVDARATPRRLDDGSTLWTGIAIDITRERNVEESFRAIYDHINAGIVEATPDGTILYANPFFCRFLGYAESEILGKNILDFTHPDDRQREESEIWVPTLGGQSENSILEKRYINREGRTVWARVNTSILRDEYGEISTAVGLVSDIGKEREELLSLIREREQRDVFLREINHRTKNNLTLIASLIRLKQRNLEGVDLSDLINRIEAIQVVYEKLHLLGSVAEVDFRDYAVDLLRRIFASMGRRPVTIVEEIDSVSLGVSDAIPVGLIINEIATNAVKYGFATTEDPVFTIRFTHDREQWQLTLANNGPPISEEAGIEMPTSMGFRIVDSTLTAARRRTKVCT